MKKGFTLFEVLMALLVLAFVAMLIVSVAGSPERPPSLIKTTGIQSPYSVDEFVYDGVKYTILVRDHHDSRAGVAMLKLKETPVTEKKIQDSPKELESNER